MNIFIKMVYKFTIILTIINYYSLFAITELNNFPSFLTCPFLHSDSYTSGLNFLSNTIKEQIKVKIEGNNRCSSLFTSVAQNINTINTLFANQKNPILQEEIREEVLSKQLLQLRLNQMLQDPTDALYLDIEKRILDVEGRLFQNEITKKYNQDIFTEKKINESLKQTFNNLSQVITSLSTADPQCVDQLGGWQQVLPIILNAMSSLSGLSGYAYSALIGSGLKILSSLSILLRDYKAKAALTDLIRHQNSKILACLYFSVQQTACEYKRALSYSREETKIKDLISQKYKDKNTKIFDEFFMLAERSFDFEKVFFDVATMGSAITLDVKLISKYFLARRASPDTILNEDDIGPPPIDSDNSPEADEKRSSWLIAVRIRGISFNEKSIMGGVKPLKDQIREAFSDINAKIADIRAVEKILNGTRSFIDLKHELDTSPELLSKVKTFKIYFQRLLNGHVISTKKKGIIASALIILLELENFLLLKYSDFLEIGDSNDYSSQKLDLSLENYTKELNKRGKKLFEVMSEGSVAQVSQQTILTIGAKVQDRLLRVFRLIESEFMNKEILDHQDYNYIEKDVIKYSEYRRDKLLLIKVANNYLTFTANATTFRAEDVEMAIRSIEKGFTKEITRMIKDSLKTKSSFYPSLEDETASHLCALFSFTLKKKGFLSFSSRKVFKSCKKRFKDLSLIKIVQPNKLAIEWEDPCFYSKYWRIVSAQKGIYEKMLDVGFISNTRNLSIYR